MADRYCTNCGHELAEDGRFCPNCGRLVHQTAQVPTPEADVPVPPPPQQQVWATAAPLPQANALPWQRSMVTKIAIGAAIVLVVLLLLGVVIMAVSVVGSGSQVSIPSFRSPQSASEVLQELKDNEIPIGESIVYTAKNDPNDLLGRPNHYTSKVNFTDTRLKPDPIADDKFDVQNGGSIEVFENKNDAIRRKEYVDSIGKGFSPISEYTYRDGTVLLRLSHRLLPKQAAEYENALKDIL
jgi:Na+-transporting methylmalonyl-CoA/oxaloacetate decarboxylase gamma subunit